MRLLFEPSGRPDSQQDYYLTAKENLCVVCGKADSYIRFDVLHRHFKTNEVDFFSTKSDHFILETSNYETDLINA